MRQWEKSGIPTEILKRHAIALTEEKGYSIDKFTDADRKELKARIDIELLQQGKRSIAHIPEDMIMTWTRNLRKSGDLLDVDEILRQEIPHELAEWSAMWERELSDEVPDRRAQA